MRMAGGLVFAAVLWVLDLRLGAALVVVAVFALSLLSVASPSAGVMIDAGIARATVPIGRLVSTILLAIFYFLAIAPLSLFLRLVGRNPLVSSGDSPESTWVSKPRVSDPAMVCRQFTVEPGVPAKGRRGRVAAVATFLGALVMLMVVDLTVGTAYVSVRGALDSNTDVRASSPSVVEEEWAADYFRELDELKMEWEPLLGMLPQDYEGRYINIANRARTTYVAEGVDDAEAASVFFFGGSTTWGFGQRDLFTIPSYVARLAEQDGVPVRVSNYGQQAWVIWQELSLLEQLLAEGNIPDVAVFYDGHNDVAQQVQQLTTDPSYPQANTVKHAVERERLRGSLPGVWDSLKSFILRHSILTNIALKFRSDSSGPAPTSAPPEIRARSAVELHKRAIEVIEGLAQSYGFEAVFIWQPNAYTTEGAEIACDWCDREGFEGFGAAYRDATEIVGPTVIDLSDSLDGAKAAVFLDDVHTNEVGAEIVARAIYSHLGLQR